MKEPRFTRSSGIFMVALAGVFLLVGAVISMAGKHAGEAHPPQVIGAEANCPTCGMHPAQYPEWQSQIVFKDKSMAAFDGGKCLFRYLLTMRMFDSTRTAADIAMVWVKDFKTGAWVDGTTASYVVGSSVMGPMGKEIIPFADQSSAKSFQQHNGGIVESYAGITMDTIKPLMGGMMHMKQDGQPMKMQ